MESTSFCSVVDSAIDSKFSRPFCRCCFSTGKRVLGANLFKDSFNDLAGMPVFQNSECPQWICYECSTLLQKALRFKHKILHAHNILYDYITKCTPLPLSDQNSSLCATEVLSINNSGRKLGYHAVLTHSNKTQPVLQVLELPAEVSLNEDSCIKQESSSDCDDNMTLEEMKSSEQNIQQQKPEFKTELIDKIKKPNRKSDSEDSNEGLSDERTKMSDTRTIDLDPEKIRIITLTEEEQIKQREEDNKAGLKFPFLCKLCFKGFNYESKLDSHMEKHSPAHGRFVCKTCHMYLSTAYTYGLHTQMHTTRYECVRCGRRMINRASIVEHYRTQHEGVIYVCNICRKVFSNFKTHQGHVRYHHSGARPRCNQCGKTFVNNNSLAEHKRIHEGVKSFACTSCDMKFRTISQLRQHRNKHHEANTKDVKDYYCVECDERFKSIHNLRKHLQKSLKHQDEKSFKFGCGQCTRRFASGPAAAAHAQVQHEGVRAHRCHTCGAGLASRSSLHKHELTVHGGRRPSRRHVCDTCGRAFRSKNVLLNHIRTHTGEKPFVCSECGRSFAQRTTMQTHYKLVHLKIRRREKMKLESSGIEEPKIEIT